MKSEWLDSKTRSLPVSKKDAARLNPGSLNPIGGRIHARRKALKFCLRDLAEQTRLTDFFLSQLERGDTNASIERKRKICSAPGGTRPCSPGFQIPR